MAGIGLNIHPNTDDPAFHLTDPTRCWLSMITHFGYRLEDLRAFMLNGLDGAWVEEETRLQWKREWSNDFDALREKYGV
jgi:adenosine deaminase